MNSNEIIIDGKVFKQYLDSIYYLSQDGEVYSTYVKRILRCQYREWNGKKYKYVDVFDKTIGKQKHTTVHRMVYTAWVGKIEEGLQVNHINDDSTDNRLCNLYVGSQKNNIQDCVNNNHRVGNVFYLTVYDKETDKVVSFCPAIEFVKYCHHSNKSGSLNKFFNKNWFKKRYKIIEYRNIKSLEEYQNVTTMGDECNPVE